MDSGFTCSVVGAKMSSAIVAPPLDGSDASPTGRSPWPFRRTQRASNDASPDPPACSAPVHNSGCGTVTRPLPSRNWMSTSCPAATSTIDRAELGKVPRHDRQRREPADRPGRQGALHESGVNTSMPAVTTRSTPTAIDRCGCSPRVEHSLVTPLYDLWKLTFSTDGSCQPQLLLLLLREQRAGIDPVEPDLPRPRRGCRGGGGPRRRHRRTRHRAPRGSAQREHHDDQPPPGHEPHRSQRAGAAWPVQDFASRGLVSWLPSRVSSAHITSRPG